MTREELLESVIEKLKAIKDKDLEKYINIKNMILNIKKE